LDKKFLEEYDQKEAEEIKRWNRQLSGKDYDPDSTYWPPSSRFQKLSEPVFFAFQAQAQLDAAAPGEIWSQIPFAGSLIIKLAPLKEPRLFKLFNGFEIGDIPRLVDFARDTGKVQFMLSCHAKNFEGLDFLYPIFTEFRPPLYGHILPHSLFSDRKKAEGFKKEFDQVARSRVLSLYKESLSYIDRGEKLNEDMRKDMAAQGFDNRWEDYLLLRALEKDAIADEVLCLFTDDPDMAFRILYAYHLALFQPLLEGRPQNMPLGFYEFYGKTLEGIDRSVFVSNCEYPMEIGAFLMKKLAPYAPSFKAMEYMVDTHKQEELYKVMNALCKAVKSRSPDPLIEKAEEIGEILESIWKDSRKIRREIKEIDCGFSLAFGVIGPIAGLLSAGYPGLLAGLGFSVAKTGLDWYGSTGKRLIKKLRPDYLANIYDFRVKYAIK
jgi:hypothetical protein